MRTTRTATVMFTGLVGSTARATRVEPARADRLRAEHFDLVGALVAEHRGTTVKTMVAVTDIAEDAAEVRDADEAERAYTGWLYRARVLPSFAAQAVDSGAITAEEATRWLTMQRRAAAEGRFFRFLAMFVVEGRVPG